MYFKEFTVFSYIIHALHVKQHEYTISKLFMTNSVIRQNNRHLCKKPCDWLQFLERVQVQYDEKAREAGVYILQSCGFDSIPADMGLVFTQQQFTAGDLNDAESYLQLQTGPEVWGMVATGV